LESFGWQGPATVPGIAIGHAGVTSLRSEGVCVRQSYWRVGAGPGGAIDIHIGRSVGCRLRLLAEAPAAEVQRAPVILAERVHKPDYVRELVPDEMYVPSKY